MASAPQSTNLPILYADLTPLNSQQHADFRLRATDAAPFLADQHAVPLTVDEFVSAQRFLPIVFSSGEDPVPLVLMGLNEGVNTIVDDEGKLIGVNYIPAYVRRYPWMLARLSPDKEELSLCFDPKVETIGAFEDGDPLFEGTEPTELTKGILAFCEQFEQAAARTAEFMKELKSYDLLMEGEVAIQPDGADKPYVYRGFQMVNEQKLRDLRGDTLRKINQSGMLPLIHAHLFSLQLIREIFQHQVDQGKMPPALVPAL
ncbi:MAG TPA: SapC family protein [Sphingobium sp.]